MQIPSTWLDSIDLLHLHTSISSLYMYANEIDACKTSPCFGCFGVVLFYAFVLSRGTSRKNKCSYRVPLNTVSLYRLQADVNDSYRRKKSKRYLPQQHNNLFLLPLPVSSTSLTFPSGDSSTRNAAGRWDVAKSTAIITHRLNLHG